ncbi:MULTISPECIES: putative quinol monooxygenase [unclassified Pantoea]|uniref:putative quinol monooxygenase n=1 Tax=unclassified Pantoea TaxID=2630326 RepID=UPI001FAA6007|nr:putative quinol monooxygenase [Pantoea sp. MQR6]
MTVPVVAIFTAKAGKEEVVEALFKGVVETTLVEEGCITYQLNRDNDNARRFVWTEEWASREALQKHLEAPHIVKLFADLPAHIESSEVIILNKAAGGHA